MVSVSVPIIARVGVECHERLAREVLAYRL